MKILIIDDHPMVRNFLKNLLCAHFQTAQIDTLYHAEPHFVNDIIAYNPTLVVLDISLSHLESLDIFLDLKQSLPQTYFVIYSMHNLPSYIGFFKTNGAHAYVLKENAMEDLARIVAEVLAGNFVFPLLLPIEDSHYRLHQLQFTAFEKSVFRALREGFNNDKLMQQLGLSKNDLTEIRKKLLLKTCAQNTTDMLKLAEEHNWLA